MKKTSQILFSSLLVLTIVGALSSSSMIWIWMMMEVNMMSVLPLLAKSPSSTQNMEQIMIFFLVQSASSNVMMLMILLMKVFENKWNYSLKVTKIVMMIMLFTKMGMAPVHLWMMKFCLYLEWIPLFLFLTIQKIIPILMLFLTFNNMMIIIFSVLNSLFGSILGFSQFSMRKILVFSSLSNMSWMLMSLTISMKMIKIFFLIYTVFVFLITFQANKMNLNYVFQSFIFNSTSKLEKNFMSFSSSKTLLFFMGFPPTIGLIPKLLMILKANTSTILIFYILIIMNMLGMIFYMRMMLTFFLNTKVFSKMSIFIKTETNTNKNKENFMLMNLPHFMVWMFIVHKIF